MQKIRGAQTSIGNDAKEIMRHRQRAWVAWMCVMLISAICRMPENTRTAATAGGFEAASQKIQVIL